MKFTSSNGDVFEGTVDEILAFYNRRDLKALPAAPIENGLFHCDFCTRAFPTKHGKSLHILKAHKDPRKESYVPDERQRIIAKAAISDKQNGVS